MSSSIFLIAFAVAVWPAFSAPQVIGPDELRARTQPYIPTPALTLRAQTQLVEVPVVVRDKHHNAVPGLQQGDFTILDAGKKQDITNFSVETFTPAPASAPAPAGTAVKPAAQPKAETPARYVALCFDDLSMDPASLIRAKAAARQFVKTSLAPGDRVAVVTTAWPKSTEFIDDVPTLLALIDKVSTNVRFSDDSAMSCPPIAPYEAYLLANNLDPGLLSAKVAEYRSCAQNPPKPEETVIAMSHGIWEHALSNSKDTLRSVDGLVQSLAQIPGRRMILLASTGFLSGNLELEEEALIQRALQSGVVINALSARGLYVVIPGGDAATPRPSGRRTPAAQAATTRAQMESEPAKDNGMAVLASATGGTFFHDNNDLLRGFREVGMVPEVMYVLGFSPTDMPQPGRFHNLKVHLNSGNGYSVQARMGYAAPSKPSPAVAAAESKVETAIAATDSLADLPVRITWLPDRQKAGVTYVAHVDVSHLKLEKREGRRLQHLTLVAVLRDSHGIVVGGERSDVDLSFTDATFDKLVAAGGFNISLTVKAPPGTYAARGLLLDGIDGKMTTSNQQVELQ